MAKIKDIFKHAATTFQKKYWIDPVWSKVISASIITAIGGIFIWIKSVVEKVSFHVSFLSFIDWFRNKTELNNALIVVLLIAAVYTCVIVIFKLRKNKAPISVVDKQDLEKQLPIVPLESTVFFSYRLASAFPGQRGLMWYNDPKTIVDRLEIVFQEPLMFQQNSPSDFSSTPFWWFRGMSSMYIESFRKLSKTKVLMGIHELEIKRMAVNIDKLYYKSFIYLEAKAEKQTGLYQFTKDDIQRHISTFGYSWEEYGLLNTLKMRREDFDDGATVVNGKVLDIYGAEIRSRYLSNYNILLAGHDCPFNSQTFEKYSEEHFNGILQNKIQPDEFFEFLSKFHKKEKLFS